MVPALPQNLSLRSKFQVSRSKPNGFTMVELIVIVALTFILAGILIGYSQSNRQVIELRTEQAKIVQVFSQAKSLAQNGIIASPGDDTPPCAYGLHLDLAANSYSVFYYNPPAPQPCDGTISSITNIPPNYGTLETHALAQNRLRFENTTDFGDILFLSQSAKVIIFDSGGATSNDPLAIDLATESGDSNVVITINPAGAISF